MQETDATVARVLALDAAIFDLDGVLTQTARLHARAWKRLFDQFFAKLASSSTERGVDLRPFDAQKDYLAHVDGKPRYDGVRDMLLARKIQLPWGSPDEAPDDDPDTATICSLGNGKNELFHTILDQEGVEIYPDSLALARGMRRRSRKVAAVSSSKNCRPILSKAGVIDIFQSIVDGRDSAERKLAGKPAPDIFLEAARRLGVEPGRAAILEDAISGVQAGRAGNFAEVVGVNRQGAQHARNLYKEGASMVLSDLTPPQTNDRL